ncbi:MAG: diguanylate cyclase domain-containing protein [Leptospirales bacterium]
MTTPLPEKLRPRWIRVQAIFLGGILLVIFLILVFGTLMLMGSVSFFGEMHDQERLMSFQHRLDTVMVDLLEEENGRRKYLLAHDRRDLAEYQEDRFRLVSVLKVLVQSDLPRSIDPKAILSLNRLVLDRVKRPSRKIATGTVNSGSRSEALHPDAPVVSMKRIRVIISGMDRTLESESVRIRLQAERQEDRLAIRALFFLGLLLVTLFLGYTYLWRHNHLMHGLNRLLEKEASHDPLTGLPNRRFLSETMGWMLARISRNPHLCALLYIDLDGFKKVNDRFGHQAGDRLLIEFSRRLVANLRKGDLVARLGGDEFVVFLDSMESREQLPAMIEAILSRLNDEPLISEIGVRDVGVSVGWAVYPEDGEDVESLIRVADRKMYERKNDTKRSQDIPTGN